MKNLLLLFTALFILASCDKDKDDDRTTNPIDKLPPATQTGANTFGCLLDGEAFKPGITSNSYQCFYQYVNGGYYFNVNANYQEKGVLKSIGIATQKKIISQEEILNLFERKDGNAYALYFTGNSNTGAEELLYTSQMNTGELKITKLDFKNNIVSGTFWFDVKDDKGVVHQIREGRFDMRFIQ